MIEIYHRWETSGLFEDIQNSLSFWHADTPKSPMTSPTGSTTSTQNQTMADDSLNSKLGIVCQATKILLNKREEYGDYSTNSFRPTTLGLMARLGIPESKRAMVTKALHSGCEAGVLEVHAAAKSSLRWAIRETWFEQLNELGLVSIEDKYKTCYTRLVDAIARSKTPRKKKSTPSLQLEPVDQPAKVETPKRNGIALPDGYSKIRDLAKARRNIFLVGPAGCGKTTVGQMIATELGLSFGTLSASGGTNEAQLLGRCVPNLQTGTTTYQPSLFINLYSDGGLFLLDEIDAAASDLLLCMNSALANGYITAPNGSTIKQHPDFVMIATANTYGTGATRSYAGRNQLDEATLDRFRIGTVTMGYSPAVEELVCPDADLRNYLGSIRRKIQAAGIRRILSTRFMKDAYIMQEQAGWTWADILGALTDAWTTDEKAKVI